MQRHRMMERDDDCREKREGKEMCQWEARQPNSGLAREFPQSCSSPYLLLLLLRWSVCAFVLLCVCIREWGRLRDSRSRK